jgi:magnesium-protoporphyrin O-methyltransferase
MNMRQLIFLFNLLVSTSYNLQRTSRFNLKYLAVNDKIEVENYFNNEGFNRWNKIYSDSDEVNKVQLDIRNGHQQTVDKVLKWAESDDNSKKTLCDAGCGVGSLSIPMAKRFKKGTIEFNQSL